MLGLGAGPKDWNENWWGINFDKPIGRMSEYVQILRGILSEPRGSYSFAGKHFQIRDYQLRQQVSSVPPIYLGTVGRQMNRLAGRIADGVLFDVCLPPLYLREAAIPAIDEGLAVSGRSRADFTLGAMIPIGIDNDRKTALRAVKRSIASHLENAYFYPVWAASGFEQEARAAQAKLKARDRAGALDAISDDFARLVGIAGTADDVRRQTAEWLALVDEVDFLTSPFLATDDEVTANQQRILETFGK